MNDERVYLFYYLKYETSIEMRTGDVIMFNLSITHCCSESFNAEFPGCIFSTYISVKTPTLSSPRTC